MSARPEPKISVVVPVYKVEASLSRCVDSILGQSFPDFELILVDDGSPDGCPELCDTYAQRDDRVVVIHQKNGGVANARNVGINASTGAWITFVDSDDFVAKEYLSELYEYRKFDLVAGSYIKIQEADKVETINDLKSVTVQNLKQDTKGIFKDGGLIFYLCWGKLFSRKVINKYNICFDESKNLGEDSLFSFQYLCKCSSVQLLNTHSYYYVSYPYSTLSKTVNAQNLARAFHAEQEIANIVYDNFNVDIQSQMGERAKRRYSNLLFDVLDSERLPLSRKKEVVSFLCNNPYFIQALENGDYRFNNISPILKSMLLSKKPLLICASYSIVKKMRK